MQVLVVRVNLLDSGLHPESRFPPTGDRGPALGATLLRYDADTSDHK